MSNGTQAFFKYMLLQALRFRSTSLYSCVGLPVSRHLIYGLRLLSLLFNIKYIIRMARFLFEFVSQAAKKSCSCNVGGTFSSCFEGTYYKYIFWIRPFMSHLGIAVVLAPSRVASETRMRSSSLCFRVLSSACGAEDTDEEAKQGYRRGGQAICGIFIGVLSVCDSGETDKEAERWKCGYICSALFDGELSLYASIRCSDLY